MPAADVVVFNDLLSIFLKCNGLIEIWKAVVDQTGSRHDHFGCKFGFGKCFGVSSQSNRWAGHRFLSQVTIWLRNDLCRIREDDTSNGWFILIFRQLIRYPLIKLFYLSNLFHILEDKRMIDVEFSGNFLCKRISFNDPLSWLMSTFDGQLLGSSPSKLSFPLQNFLNYLCPVHLLSVPGWNPLLMLWVVSTALWPILNSRKSLEFAFCLTSFP